MLSFGLVVFTEILTSAFKYLAWPITVLIIARLFKKELVRLFGRLKKTKFGVAEFEFADYVDQVEYETDIPATDESENISLIEAEQASIDPRGAILSAWVEVEDIIFRLIKNRNLDMERNVQTGAAIKIKAAKYSRSRNVLRAIRAIQKSQILDSSYIALLHDLRNMRNEAAHTLDFNPPPSSVIKYIQLAKYVSTALIMAME